MDYTRMARFEAEHYKEAYDTEVGMRIVCECREKNATRLFIRSLNKYCDYLDKEGWWNTFTLSIKPCENTGNYICKIEEFKIDRNGFLMCIVAPEKYLGDSTYYESKMWNYLDNWIMSNRYLKSSIYGRFNTLALEQQFKEEILEYMKSEEYAKEYKEKYGRSYGMASRVVVYNHFINGTVTVEEIDKLLETPDDLEQLVLDIIANKKGERISYLEEYPNAMEKINRYIDGLSYIHTGDIMEYVTRLCWKYDEINYGGKDVCRNERDVMEKLEALAIHYKKDKALEKEAKKAARLAKKQANKKEIAI